MCGHRGTPQVNVRRRGNKIFNLRLPDDLCSGIDRVVEEERLRLATLGFALSFTQADAIRLLIKAGLEARDAMEQEKKS